MWVKSSADSGLCPCSHLQFAQTQIHCADADAESEGLLGQSPLPAVVLTCWRTLISDMSCLHFSCKSARCLSIFCTLSCAPPLIDPVICSSEEANIFVQSFPTVQRCAEESRTGSGSHLCCHSLAEAGVLKEMVEQFWIYWLPVKSGTGLKIFQ